MFICMNINFSPQPSYELSEFKRRNIALSRIEESERMMDYRNDNTLITPDDSSALSKIHVNFNFNVFVSHDDISPSMVI